MPGPSSPALLSPVNQIEHVKPLIPDSCPEEPAAKRGKEGGPSINLNFLETAATGMKNYLNPYCYNIMNHSKVNFHQVLFSFSLGSNYTFLRECSMNRLKFFR